MEAQNKADLYFNAYYNTLLKYKQAFDENPNQDFKPFYKKIIVYAIKYIITKEEPQYVTLEDANNDFMFADIITKFIGQLTPREFMQLYPIDKEYKGHKYGYKDYFHTKYFLESIDLDKPIGSDAVEFLWEYNNREIFEFNIKIMEYLSRLRRLQGKPSLSEEFAEIMGLETYRLYKDNKGNEFLVDKKGKSYKIKKKYPFKVYKGGRK